MGDGKGLRRWQTNRHTASVAEVVRNRKGNPTMAALFAPVVPGVTSEITSAKKRRTERRRKKRDRRKDRRERRRK
jgi:hypothetical protein